MPTGPLAGLRVLDITQYIAGPTLGRILADLGAEVVKLEMPPEGEYSRKGSVPPPVEEPLREALGSKVSAEARRRLGEAGRARYLKSFTWPASWPRGRICRSPSAAPSWP